MNVINYANVATLRLSKVEERLWPRRQANLVPAAVVRALLVSAPSLLAMTIAITGAIVQPF